jgi:hypothetical protein
MKYAVAVPENVEKTVKARGDNLRVHFKVCHRAELLVTTMNVHLILLEHA